MLNNLLHIIGICPCHHAHFDLMDLLFLGIPVITFVSYKFKNISDYFVSKVK